MKFIYFKRWLIKSRRDLSSTHYVLSKTKRAHNMSFTTKSTNCFTFSWHWRTRHVSSSNIFWIINPFLTKYYSSAYSGSNPVLISLPAALTGMKLETRLVTYDWKNQFKNFQAITRRGSFRPLCWSAKNTKVPVSHKYTSKRFIRKAFK